MRKTITTSLVLAVSLLCLFILGACPPGAGTDTTGAGTPNNKVRQVIIKNIPSTVREDGPDSFKIYVQLSTSTKDTDPHTAISSGRITNPKKMDDSVILSLYEDQEMTTPWKGSGSYYIAVTISPQNALSEEDIRVKVPGIIKSKVSSEFTIIDWEKSMELGTFGDLGKARIKAIYDRIIKEDSDIITDPE